MRGMESDSVSSFIIKIVIHVAMSDRRFMKSMRGMGGMGSSVSCFIN